jgi:hypothetical protein
MTAEPPTIEVINDGGEPVWRVSGLGISVMDRCGARARELWHQMVICVHEMAHIGQYRKHGPIGFGLAYLTSAAARTEFEIEAYTVNLEMNYWRYGKTGSARKQAQSLRGYAVSAKDIEIAEAALGSAAHTIRQGGVVTDAMAVALPWLNDCVGRLRKAK